MLCFEIFILIISYCSVGLTEGHSHYLLAVGFNEYSPLKQPYTVNYIQINRAKVT